MKIALLGDCHFGARNDNQSVFDHMMEFFDRVFFPYLTENNIDTIIQLGDFTDHRRYVNIHILGQVQRRIIDVCADLGIVVHQLVGNHDIYYKQSLEVSSTGTLFQSDNFFVYDKPTTIVLDQCHIDIIPWITKRTAKSTEEFIRRSRSTICCSHSEFGGFNMFNNVVSHSDQTIDEYQRYDFVFSGHYHHKSTAGNIHYLGTPYDITWMDYGDMKGFHIFDTETADLNMIVNPYRLHHHVTINDELLDSIDISTYNFDQYNKKVIKLIIDHAKGPDVAVWVDQFREKLELADPINISIVDIDRKDPTISAGELDNIDADDVLTILNKNATALLKSPDQHKKLHNLLNELFIEATTLRNEL